MSEKNRSQLQERLVSLYLRLNGYLQSGYIPHSEVWGNVGTDIDRIGIRFPHHLQVEREILDDPKLDIPKTSIDIIIAEVKNSSLKFNDTLFKADKRAEKNWFQILNWIGLFDTKEVQKLIPEMIKGVERHSIKTSKTHFKYEFKSKFGLITLRPMLFSIEKNKKEVENKIWINGEDILSFIWKCFCPEFKRAASSTKYPYALWGEEFFDIVNYIKMRHEKGEDVGTTEEMYSQLINSK